MKAPKCRLCHQEHWPREGCSFGSVDRGSPRKGDTETSGPTLTADDRPKGRETRKRPVESTQSGNNCGPKPSALPTLNAPKFDRNAYQRDYMRDKRLADKLGLTVQAYRARKDI